ncbi:hypothetical protein IGB42_02110 [Andreprevotia sp. IGB-42]|uniref:type IV pilus modification PilV family protein n=1 Tax=Andreprevotia sp. IGB-42 TaxID=2497473 RepID=UPI0013577426|nr:prepilin-type N-terminal cleavage/methylation domain-containing protein [Andreprevotia sp. IGB-42]KAF0813182.1 hypothetical protein IGB42_02110 [Andreprevotia sp. IGB-42]
MQPFVQQKQEGFSLLEVLIAVVILSVGLLALAGFNGNLYRNVRYSSDRAKAMASAQQFIDNARAQDISTLTTGADSGNCTSTGPHREWTVSPVTGADNTRLLSMYVCWTDSTNQLQQLALTTKIVNAQLAGAATPTAVPTSAPSPTPVPVCTAPQYVKGSAYSDGDTVKNGGRQYVCKVGVWCKMNESQYYTPGTGSAWQQAWTDIGSC